MISAWELFNVLKYHSYEQLKELDVVIEVNLASTEIEDTLIARYATKIEEYSSHIRISQI